MRVCDSSPSTNQPDWNRVWVAGVVFLQEADERGQGHHAADHRCRLEVAGAPRHNGQHREQQVEGVDVAVPQVQPAGHGCVVAHQVVTAAAADVLRLAGVEPIRVAAQAGQQGLGFFHRGGLERPGQVGRHVLADRRVAEQLKAEVAQEVSGEAPPPQARQEVGVQYGMWHRAAPVKRQHPEYPPTSPVLRLGQQILSLPETLLQNSAPA